MKTIWKWNLMNQDEQQIDMPRGAKILTVQDQYGQLTMWAVVDREQTWKPARS